MRVCWRMLLGANGEDEKGHLVQWESIGLFT